MQTGASPDGDGHPRDPRAYGDPERFRREQAALAHAWTFLGFASGLKNDGDWFRATLATREVFVQRFGETIRGFENVCAHRYFPLRNAEAGNGPVVCGLHHWRYDADGRAVGVPHCPEIFGKTPRDLDARLKPLDIATCGDLLFGRFPCGDARSLKDFLGAAFPSMAAMSRAGHTPLTVSKTVAANWKFSIEAALDDYHLVAVHPDTFGRIGYLKRERIFYHRFGLSSAYFTTPDPEAMNIMARECEQGVWRSANYRTFNVFPNFAIAHFQAYAQFWYILVMQFTPLAVDRTDLRAWMYPAPFPANHTPFHAATQAITEPARRQIVRYFSRKVMNEDNAVCEKLQTIAANGGALPLLGKLEQRVGWFHEALAQFTGEA